MCGIIAYKGKGDALDIVVDGLKKLEYRGYDSWGIASVDDKLNLIKKVGRIGDFNLDDLKLGKSIVALGHTRWATHGGVSTRNAHPQLDCKDEFVVVHNGIIENFQELKQELIMQGHDFKSETDTEIIAHMLEQNLDEKTDFKQVIVEISKKIKGRNAIVFFHKPTSKVYALRKGAPLVIGTSEKGNFIASDVPAFIEHTNKVIFLEDEEGAELNSRLSFFSLEDGKEIKKKVEQVDWSVEQARKGVYEDFTIKEILEQPNTIEVAAMQDEEMLTALTEKIDKADNAFLIGCGTASYAALTGKYMFSRIAGKHMNFAIASEFSDHQHLLTDDSLVIAISQSGETADLIEAVELAEKRDVEIAGIVNVMGSSILRKSGYPLLMKAGPEISVVSTKAFTSQLAILLLLAHASANKLEQGKNLLKESSRKIESMLTHKFQDKIKKIAEQLKNKQHIYVIGKGMNYPIALEAALKIKEISYIHAEGFASGELKHGVIALIEEGTPCIVIVSNDEDKYDIINSAMQVRSRGGMIIGISPEYNEVFDIWIEVPDCGAASPIANVIPAQLLAYNLAKTLKLDPDKPRNLAKSVTVK